MSNSYSQRLALVVLLLGALFIAKPANAQLNGDWLRLDSNSPRVEMHTSNGKFQLIPFGGVGSGFGIYLPDQVYPSFWMDRYVTPGMFGLYDVGVSVGGSFHPDAALHLRSLGTLLDRPNSIGLAKILVENVGDHSIETRSMIELVNRGGVRFELSNDITGRSWAFQTNNSDNFLINLLGSGGNEFSIRKTGMVTMGPGGVKNFLLDTAGNLTIKGTLNQASDRDVKEDFANIDRQIVLKKLSALPIGTWRYKKREGDTRHLGPTAQDFHSAFGLGQDNRTISVTDASGVALVSIQALNEKVEALEIQLKQRDEQIERLSRMVEQLAAANQ